MYCLASEVANTATGGWEELAQRASPVEAGVDGELLRAAVAGQSLADWPPEAQALAAEAVLRLNDAIDKAGRHIDTYLFPRYRQVMPLAQETVEASSLPGVCAALALRRLWGASLPAELRRGPAWAAQYLVDVSTGIASLGQVDTAVAQAPGQTVARSQAKRFDWDGY